MEKEKKEIYRRQQVFEQELALYEGDDPLKLRYDFISWLDESYGKENVMDIFFPILEDTLKCFWNVVKYQQDCRFLQLLITYISMQNNPTDMYKTIYEKGTGIESPIFYISWANAYVEKEDYKKADEIFNLGLTKIKSKTELKNSYDQFLIMLGKKFLLLINSENMLSICPKCSNNVQKNGTTPHFTPRNEEVQCWELNPLKVGEPDDFKCPVVVHDPPDSSKKPMYPKHLVYVGGKEYSLEEIRAKACFEKEVREESETIRDTALLKVQSKGDIAMKDQIKEADGDKKEFCREVVDQENEMVQDQEDIIQNHVSSPPKSTSSSELSNKKGLPPLLMHDSLTISQTSYTAHMKEAMNVVQEMWSSPTPAVSTAVPTRGRALYKSSAESVKETPFNNENSTATSLSKKSVPFSIYTEDEEAGACIPTPTGRGIRPGMPKALTSLKKDSLQMREQLGKGNNVLSERKPKGTFEGQEFDKYPPVVVPSVKQQLPFSNAVKVEDNQNDLLAMKLGEVSLVNNGANQQNRITIIKPLLPSEQDDFSDVTCNTKAFNFSLPSSTPIQNKKFPATRTIVESQGHTEDQTQGKSLKTPGRLSLILEASKERYSSSSSSNGCPPREQSGVPLHSVGASKLCLGEIQDPFCPKLLERLLSSVNFPQNHHAENYYVINTSLPSIGKTLKLGNEMYTVAGDIGKGAYARIVKASVQNRICALKIEKPPCKWEHYICREIQKRVDSSVKSCFMNIKNAYIFNGGSILESDWAQYGTLLNVINQHKIVTGKLLHSTVILHFAIEIVDIVDFLHQCNIIHADIKPDNFVVRTLPSINETQRCIQLIDFGRSIDMRLFPPGTQFTTVVKTEGFTCCEMKERKPWTYQTDLYGLAATIYCLIVGEYMVVEKKNNEWKLHKPFPRSVRNLWEPVFSELLNIESCDKLPSLVEIKALLQAALISKDKFLLTQNYNSLENVLKGK